ncbi:MAG: SAM-dependent methyltransferase [Gemmatimonadetes bacterium]|nr:MAG: SAM-dependent methyltransferase [Gemmatimonadota bacterium]
MAENVLDKVERYYTERFVEHGATARGVDWNGEESQRIRFAQLLRIGGDRRAFSLNDIGCGYGALVDFLEEQSLDVEYTGFDLSRPMIDHARERHPTRIFVDSAEALQIADYTVASGIFNVKLDTSKERWLPYVLETIRMMDDHSRRGFAFNMLTSYSDPERCRADLYYGDPAFFFDLCKRGYARNVALLHDYGLWEWTILVRKELDS